MELSVGSKLLHKGLRSSKLNKAFRGILGYCYISILRLSQKVYAMIPLTEREIMGHNFLLLLLRSY